MENRANHSRIKIGIVFSSMDRYELIRVAMDTLISGIDAAKHEVTIFWQDGSIEEPALHFFNTFESEKVKFIKRGGIRGFGPDPTNQNGIDTLLQTDNFDWVGIIESDVFLREDWLVSCLEAVEKAKAAKLNPGVFTPFVLDVFVAEHRRDFSILHTTGNSGVFFLPKAWKAVPRCDSQNITTELVSEFGMATIITKGRLPYDCMFAPCIYQYGFDVIGTPITKLYNCGFPRQGNWVLNYKEKNPVLDDSVVKVHALGERNFQRWEKRSNELSIEYVNRKKKKSFREKLPKGLRARLRGLKLFLFGSPRGL